MKRYECGCCGKKFKCHNTIQKYFDQDNGYGICRECVKVGLYRTDWLYYMLENTGRDNLKRARLIDEFIYWLLEKESKKT